MIEDGEFLQVAERAVRIESRTNLLFSLEKMALRDAVRSRAGARTFSEGLYDLLHGPDALPNCFERWGSLLLALVKKSPPVIWPI